MECHKGIEENSDVNPDNYEVASPVSFHGWAGSLWCMIPINAKIEMKINGAMAEAVRSTLQADC